VRRQLPLAIAGIALLGILAFAAMFMVSAWTRTAAQLSVHGLDRTNARGALFAHCWLRIDGARLLQQQAGL